MGSVGLRIKSSESGLDLADTLAKAFLGDPATESAIARNNSLMQTDEVNRQKLEAEILRTQGLTATEAWELAGRKKGAPVAGQILEDAASMGTPAPAAPPPPELAPVVLPPSLDLGAAVPTATTAPGEMPVTVAPTDLTTPPAPMKQVAEPPVTVAAPGAPDPNRVQKAKDYAEMLIANGGDVATAIEKAAGMFGLVYNPNLQLTPTERVATLAGGGGAISKDSAAAAADDPAAAPGTYEGTGLETQDHNTINQVLELHRNGQPIPPALISAYGAAWGRQYGTPRMQRVDVGNGNFVDRPMPPYIPPGVLTPEQLSGGGPAVPPAPAKPPADPAAPVVVADPAAVVTADPAAPVVPGAKPGDIPVKTADEPQTERSGLYRTGFDRMAEAETVLSSVTEDDLTGASAWASEVAQRDPSGNILIDSVLQSLPEPRQRSRAQAALAWTMGRLRAESGATIGDEELARELRISTPGYGDTTQIEEKRQGRLQTMRNFLREGYGREDSPAYKAAVARVKRDYNIDLSGAPAKKTTAPTKRVEDMTEDEIDAAIAAEKAKGK